MNMDIDLKKEQFLDKKLEDTRLSTRLVNALKYGGVFTIREALNIPKEKLLRFRNLGKMSFEELYRYAEKNNLI